MRFGLDQWVLEPPLLEALLSLLLVAGCDAIGAWLLTRLGLRASGRPDALRLQAVPVGAAALAALLYPAALMQLTTATALKTAAWGLIAVGMLQFFRVAAAIYGGGGKRVAEWLGMPRLDATTALIGVILLALLLLALAPITNADALDYHIGVAIDLLNHGGLPFRPEWFTSRLAGNGEVLNALGLSVGAGQFGALLQFASLLALIGLVAGVRADDWSLDWSDDVKLAALAAVSAPVLLFLVSAPKPQLWPIALTTLAFALLLHRSFEHGERSDMLVRYALVCGLALTAMQAKFNYLLGGGLVGLFGLWLLARRGALLSGLMVGAVAALLISGPPMVCKMLRNSVGPLAALLTPLPGYWPGTDKFVEVAQRASDFTSALPFPLSILIPTGLGGLSTVVGVGWLILWRGRPRKLAQFWPGLAVTMVLVLVSLLLAPPSARVYMEPYCWAMVLIVVGSDPAPPRRWISWALHGQALLFLVAASFGVATLAVGLMSSEARERVMMRSAAGYDLMREVDAKVPADAFVLNSHRSMALLPRDGVSAQWMSYVDPTTPAALPYLQQLRERQVTHMLVLDDQPTTNPLAGCFGPVVAGPLHGHVATRNPFNEGPTYQAWVMQFDAWRLPTCAMEQSAH